MTEVTATLRRDLLTIVRAAIRAADAGGLVTRALDARHESSRPGKSGGLRELNGPASIVIIAAGKAAARMAHAAIERLAPRLRGGIAIGPRGADLPRPLESVIGGHPLPTSGSERGGRRALAIAGSLTSEDTLLVLLSGGASALMAVPADGLTLDDKIRTTDRLLRAGADIEALNTVRKHMSAIKGGWLAANTSARTITCAISDVVGDDLGVIASGPTVADRSTFRDALDVLIQSGGVNAYPAAVVRRFERGIAGEIVETAKPGDPRLAGAESAVIGSRRDAIEGAADEARRLGYCVVTIEEPIIGEARDAARTYVERVRASAEGRPRPLCILSGGETTVRVVGSGRGGRNQEFVLAVAALLSEPAGPIRETGPHTVLASVGTDGIDGPTDAAGAIADATTIERARSAGLADPTAFLNDNNAYAFFDALGDLIHTGPTDTNVGDLQAVLLA